MSNNATKTTTPTTVPPCPDWCVLGDYTGHAAGNDFETLNSGDAMVRNHESTNCGFEPFSFVVCTEEMMRSGVIETSNAYILIHNERLDARQVRQLGKLLLATADDLDEINGA